jgi:hypothetical protein
MSGKELEFARKCLNSAVWHLRPRAFHCIIIEGGRGGPAVEGFVEVAKVSSVLFIGIL